MTATFLQVGLENFIKAQENLQMLNTSKWYTSSNKTTCKTGNNAPRRTSFPLLQICMHAQRCSYRGRSHTQVLVPEGLPLPHYKWCMQGGTLLHIINGVASVHTCPFNHQLPNMEHWLDQGRGCLRQWSALILQLEPFKGLIHLNTKAGKNTLNHVSPRHTLISIFLACRTLPISMEIRHMQHDNTKHLTTERMITHIH